MERKVAYIERTISESLTVATLRNTLIKDGLMKQRGLQPGHERGAHKRITDGGADVLGSIQSIMTLDLELVLSCK